MRATEPPARRARYDGTMPRSRRRITGREQRALDAGWDPHPDDFREPPARTKEESEEIVSDFVREVRRLQGRCYSCGTHLTGGLCPECTTTMEGQEHD